MRRIGVADAPSDDDPMALVARYVVETSATLHDAVLVMSQVRLKKRVADDVALDIIVAVSLRRPDLTVLVRELSEPRASVVEDRT